MKKTEDSIRRAGSHISLTESEREHMKERLQEYMSYVPARGSGHTHAVARVHVFSTRITAVFAILAVVFTSGIGITYASHDALPGEPLFVVKEVGEEVRARLTFDAVEKAQWEVERAHRRLEEIEVLAQEGALDEETQVVVAEKYQERLVSAQQHIAKLSPNEPEQAHALRVALFVGADAYTKVLEQPAVPGELALRNSQNDARSRVANAIRMAGGTTPPVVAVAQRDAPRDGAVEVEKATTIATLDTSPTDVVAPDEEASAHMAVARNASVTQKVDTTTNEHDPRVVSALLQVLDQQIERFEARVVHLQDETRRARAEKALVHIKTMHADARMHIQEGEYAKAHILLSKALEAVHTARAQFGAFVEITIPESEPTDGDTSEHVQKKGDDSRDVHKKQDVHQHMKVDIRRGL